MKMGGWGSGVFENDYALDWLLELYRIGSPDFIIQTLRATVAIPEPGDLPDELEWQVLAAAELIAAMCGRPSADFPDDARDWITNNTMMLSSDLIALASSAVERSLAYWNVCFQDWLLYSGDQDNPGRLDGVDPWDEDRRWRATIDDLRGRLRYCAEEADALVR